ncbi:unnamed protein product [Onchocerca flexuosa]|uniref:Uncharacterized protein n=1 Tax=Onchocerca flexuosa TaxID=387005 RepID=A0A183I1D0_9BILA|nr:unnamed protein product [Onchocerca flexuosa]
MTITMLNKHRLPLHVHARDHQLNPKNSVLHLSIIIIGLNRQNVIGLQNVIIIIQGIREMKGDERGRSGEQKKTDVIELEVEMVDAKLLRRIE